MAVIQKMLMGLVLLSVSVGVGAEVHHIVGGERGWDPYADIGSWSSGRTFRVGDKIWFTHHAAQGTIAEVVTREEYITCNVSNPIRMYTDDIDAISLDEEGIRYFTSSNSKKCKNGLKLHVEVVPEGKTDTTSNTQVNTSENSYKAIAEAPDSSGSARFGASFALVLAGFWLCYLGV